MRMSNVILGLIALVALALGVRSFLGARDAESQGAALPSDGGPFLTSPHTTISIARFSRGNTPDNCADVTFWVERPIDFKQLEARGFVVLKSTCAKAFKNLTAFATCTRSDKDADGGPSTDGAGYYYDIATIEGDDIYSGQCLGTGGSWVVKPNDDPGYARAHARTPVSEPRHEIDSLMELAH
jgi:hypothetical protein